MALRHNGDSYLFIIAFCEFIYCNYSIDFKSVILIPLSCYST